MARGVELMLYGMGTVVLFLALLVIATSTMSRLLSRYLPEAEPAPAAPSLPGVRTATPEQEAQLVAVITAAIRQHRARRK